MATRQRSSSRRPSSTPIRARQSTGRRITRYALAFPLIQFFHDVLNLDSRFSLVTIKKGKNSTFTVTKLCVALVALIILECERFTNLNTDFRDEGELAQALGLPRMFERTVAYRFLRSFGGWHVNQLQRVLEQLVRDHGECRHSTRKIVDIDGSTHNLYGRKTEGGTPGKNKRHPGKDCYQQSVAFCSGDVVSLSLDRGEVHCRRRLELLLDQASKILGKIYLVRLDAGYFAIEALRYVVAKADHFIVCGTRSADGVQRCIDQAVSQPGRWKKAREGSSVQDFQAVQVFKGGEERYRVVVVASKKELKKVHKHCVRRHRELYIYALVTNLPRERMKAQRVYSCYHGRQAIEQFFKEMKYAFHGGKMPSTKFRANQAFAYLVCIAYNSFQAFRRTALPREHRNKSLATIRRRYMVNAVLVMEDEALVLEFDHRYQHFRSWVQIQQRVNAARAS